MSTISTSHDELQALRQEITQQLSQLDARLRDVEEQLSGGGNDARENSHDAGVTQPELPAGSNAQELWALNELAQRYDQPAVMFAGTAETEGGPVMWQYGRFSEHLKNTDAFAVSPALEAIAHPIRLTLLLAIINGTTTSAKLAELEQVGTSGQVYHHLSQLNAAGWIRSVKRGQWEVPASKVIPLLTIILAAQ